MFILFLLCYEQQQMYADIFFDPLGLDRGLQLEDGTGKHVFFLRFPLLHIEYPTAEGFIFFRRGCEGELKSGPTGKMKKEHRPFSQQTLDDGMHLQKKHRCNW